jgi:hypothetical protein
VRTMKQGWIVLLVIGGMLAGAGPVAADMSASTDVITSSLHRVMWVVSPMAGVDENKLEIPMGPMGTKTEKDTGPEYGVSLLMIHPNVVLNDFAFYSQVNDADVWGNLFFANYYVNSQAPFTWNFGVGHLYHLIDISGPSKEEITVTDPMIKSGPIFRIPPLHLQMNPYLGYAWERVESKHGDESNGSYLYGLTVVYHWRMIEAGFSYYYQDSQGLDPDVDFNVLRARANVFFNKNWGIAMRGDYMEHQTTTDTSFLIGPVFVF